jgi:hypothetical protein
MTDRTYLATITLSDGHRGRLWWQDGDIWVRDTMTGAEWSTETGCPNEADAIDTISAAWSAYCHELTD